MFLFIEHDFNELSAAAQSLKPGMAVVTGASLKTKSQLTDAIKESCLPKMLCELASKADYQLSEKERELLRLIRWVETHWGKTQKAIYLSGKKWTSNEYIKAMAKQ